MNDETTAGAAAGFLPLAPEAGVGLVLDGKPLAMFMCSPYDLDELAVGHLVARGLIASKADLLSLSVCPDMRSVQIATISGIGANLEPEGIIFSACGAARVEPARRPPARTAPAPEMAVSQAGSVNQADSAGQGVPTDRAGTAPSTLSLEQLTAWAASMFAAAELYRRTGGLHVAALACGSVFIVREDVGRHNAVDKVLGRGLLDGVDFSSSVILTSGRIAADMAMKAVNAGVPILVTRSIPTTEAYSIALASNLTLVGRIGSKNPIVYSGHERIQRHA